MPARTKTDKNVLIALITSITSVVIAVISVIVAPVIGKDAAEKRVDELQLVRRYKFEILNESKFISGTTTRQVIKQITFEPEFSSPPEVFCIINALDIKDGETEESLRIKTKSDLDHTRDTPGIRYHVFATNITKKGCEIYVQTWSQTELYFIAIDVFAIPPQLVLKK